MPSVTYDGRSFQIDGRRIWIVGGTVDWARTPRQQWADRIHAAKLAGLNTVAISVAWNRHEQLPNRFDFTGDNDIRGFVRLVGSAGMWCILRAGPFISDAWDSGGLPPWLLHAPGVALRTANSVFLEACSRFITALADQVRDLQVTSSGKGGPILLLQNESAWTCGNDELAAAYLGELGRYFREAGFNVPIINANNLWQGLEGEIDCWTGRDHLLSTVRQLAAVRADQPRLIVELQAGSPRVWGAPEPAPEPPARVQRRMAEALAAGGQVNLHPFHAGQTPGYFGGRAPEAPGSFAAAAPHADTPLTVSGAPGASYAMVRRLATFASRFSRVLANLDPLYQPVILDPSSPARRGASVSHAVGTHGSIVFIFAPEDDAGRGQPASVMLPDGVTLPVEFGSQLVAWWLFQTKLGPRADLDYTNLNALASVGRVLVCFGPAGADGRFSVNGTPLEVRVPTGAEPHVVEHESLLLVVLNESQADAAYATDDAVYLGVAGLRADGTPILGNGPAWRISDAGVRVALTAPAVAGRGRRSKDLAHAEAPGLQGWARADADDYAAGTSARYATIPGPAELSDLGAPYGYGWYRVRVKSARSRQTTIALPHAADRVHVFADGKRRGVLGFGPGAAHTLDVALRAGEQEFVLLAENLGRAGTGVALGERKGVFGHVWEVAPARAGRPTIKQGEPIDLLRFRSPLWEVHEGDLSSPWHLTWTLPARRRHGLVASFGDLAQRGVLIVNGKALRFLDASTMGRVVIEAEHMGRGQLTVQFAPVGPGLDALDAARPVLKVLGDRAAFLELESALTQRAEWSFAKWEPPAPSAFGRERAAAPAQTPAWWRATFTGPDPSRPLCLDASGLTKGQLYLNGTHVCRYFVATGSGRPVPPQSRYLLPAPALRETGENELVLFDEHGASPKQVRLVYDDASPIRA